MAKNTQPRLNMAVIGGTGLDRTGFVHSDFLPILNGHNAVKVYREMSDNDPVIGAFMYAVTMVLRSVHWRVEAATAADISKDAAEEARIFAESLMDDMSHPWNDFIAQALSFLVYGYSVHEIVYKRRGGPYQSDPTQRSKFDDGRIGLRKLAPRPQETVFRWDIQPDDGGVRGVEQFLMDGIRSHAYLPIEKILLFRMPTTNNSPEGRSILRNSYVPYQRKLAIEGAEGRSAMRSAGVVVLRVPGNVLDPSADAPTKAIAASFQSMASQLAQDRQGAMVLPSNTDAQGKPMYSLEYVATDGTRAAKMSEIIERYDKRIAASVLADWILMGQQSVGSFALSSDKTNMFVLTVQAYLQMIAEPLNRFLLPRVWELNNFDPTLMPKFVPGDISRRALEELGNFIAKIAAAGMPLFPDLELENKVRDAAGLPPLTQEQHDELVLGGEEDARLAAEALDDDEVEEKVPA